MNLAKPIGILIAIIISIATFIWWTGENDKEFAAWAEAYEQCVKVEYNTTPWAWYAEQGEYPPCNVNILEV